MSDNSEREAFEKWYASKHDGFCPSPYEGEYDFADAQMCWEAWQQAARAQGEPSSGVTALTSDLSARINRVSRRSLDGSVVMSSGEWNGIVELVEKLLTVTQQGGVPEETISAVTSLVKDAAAAHLNSEFSSCLRKIRKLLYRAQPEGDVWIKCSDRLPKLGQRVQPTPDMVGLDRQAIELLDRVQGWWQNTDGDMPASLEQDIAALLTAAPAVQAVQAVQGGGEPVGTIIDVGGQQFIDIDDETLNSLPVGTKLYTHLHNGEQGGEWVRCDERKTDAINHALDVLSKHGDAFTSIGAMQVLEEMLEPQPPKAKEGE